MHLAVAASWCGKQLRCLTHRKGLRPRTVLRLGVAFPKAWQEFRRLPPRLLQGLSRLPQPCRQLRSDSSCVNGLFSLWHLPPCIILPFTLSLCVCVLFSQAASSVRDRGAVFCTRSTSVSGTPSVLSQYRVRGCDILGSERVCCGHHDSSPGLAFRFPSLSLGSHCLHLSVSLPLPSYPHPPSDISLGAVGGLFLQKPRLRLPSNWS